MVPQCYSMPITLPTNKARKGKEAGRRTASFQYKALMSLAKSLCQGLAEILQCRDETFPRWGGIKHMNPLHSFCLQLFWIPAALEKTTRNPCKGLWSFVPSLHLSQKSRELRLCICLCWYREAALCTEQLCWAGFCRNQASLSSCWNCVCFVQPPS